MAPRRDAADLAIGVGVLGLRIGGAAAKVALASARVTMSAPVIGPPLRAATDRIAADGKRAREDAQRWIEQTASEVVESQVALEMTDQVLQSAVVQHTIDRIASSPEIRGAITEQTAGMAQQTIEGVRKRSVVLDDVAEQTVRRGLRRQPPQSS